jgi:ABC-type lipoprotein export system ATPase subunit
MPTEYLKKIFENQEDKKIMVVAILGPQSSGKSTLLNFVLGCDFMSSAGRCTKGIYGTYF